MQSYGADHIRNVVLLSHCGAGKTSLSEAMLFTSGAIPRLGRVDDGSSTSDFDPDEIKRKISISLSVLPCEWSGNKVNVLDAPGDTNFMAVTGETRVISEHLMTSCERLKRRLREKVL